MEQDNKPRTIKNNKEGGSNTINKDKINVDRYYKDCSIMAQSQLQRAIEITELTGFPEGVNTPKEQIKYLTDRVTPWLIKKCIDNALDHVDYLAESIKNKSKGE